MLMICYGIGLNIICDHMARTSRKKHCEDVTLAKAFPDWPEASIYKITPDESPS